MGILCEGPVFPAWQAACLRDVLALGFVEPVLLVVDAAGARGRAAPRGLCDRLFGRRGSRADRPTDLSADLGAAARLACLAPEAGGRARHLAPEEVDRIRAHDLDFLLRLGFARLSGAIHSAARLGVWSYRHVDAALDRGWPPFLAEFRRGEPVLGVALRRLPAADAAADVLACGWYRSVPHSYVRTADAALFAGAGLVAKACRDARAGAATAHADEALDAAGPPPGVLGSLALCARLARRKAFHAGTSLLREETWNVGRLDVPLPDLVRGGEAPPARWFEPPSGPERRSVMADPFGVRRSDALTVLCERAETPEGKGRIVAFDWTPAGTTPHRTALERPTHLSYPFLLQDGPDLYCVPESSATGEVALLRAVAFPTRWERAATLLTGVAALDATLVRWEERWWLLAATKGRGESGTSLELHAWHARSLFGPYEPHAGNPVVSDVRSSRPAGTPFVHEGRLYRPAQDCSRTYGGAVAFCRIDRLTPTEFSETVVGVLRPARRGPYRDGLHTVAACGDATLIDGKRWRWSVRPAIPRLLRALRRRLGGSGPDDTLA
jgi:hypothetical protein